MEMYQELHKWDESIKIAEKKNHPQVKELKENYYMWLIQTKQEAKVKRNTFMNLFLNWLFSILLQAGEVKENEKEYTKAIQLYLQANLPAKAANIVFTYDYSFS